MSENEYTIKIEETQKYFPLLNMKERPPSCIYLSSNLYSTEKAYRLQLVFGGADKSIHRLVLITFPAYPDTKNWTNLPSMICFLLSHHRMMFDDKVDTSPFIVPPSLLNRIS